MQKLYGKSFHGKLWDECLNEHWFGHLVDARAKSQGWRQDCTRRQLHTPQQESIAEDALVF